MSKKFGNKVLVRGKELAEAGKDVNQISTILFTEDQSTQKRNYGIGILLGVDGKPLQGSPILQDYLAREVDLIKVGNYFNSSNVMDELKKKVLTWQRIPQIYWEHFSLVMPSDAGTGAVMTGMQTLLSAFFPRLDAIAVEALGWPAYQAMAITNRVAFRDFVELVFPINGFLPVYQLGALNTTGKIIGQDVWEERAYQASQHEVPVLLDRAYSGFDAADMLLHGADYDALMEESIASLFPFLQHQVTFALAISPTKAFVTFNSRPGGFLLLYTPDKQRLVNLTKMANLVNRARGSSFEHPVTRAMVQVFLNKIKPLQLEHQRVLQRVAEANAMWEKCAAGTPLERYFTKEYGGMFRNFPIKEGTAEGLYAKHIYPVFSNGMCRINTTGISGDEEVAKRDVLAFAECVSL